MVNCSRKILCDVTIRTDHAIEARNPEMVVSDKTENESKIVYFACPFDSRNDLKTKMKKLWYMPVNPCSSSRCIMIDTTKIKAAIQ